MHWVGVWPNRHVFPCLFFLIDLIIAQRAGMALTTGIKQVIAVQEKKSLQMETLPPPIVLFFQLVGVVVVRIFCQQGEPPPAEKKMSIFQGKAPTFEAPFPLNILPSASLKTK